MAFHCRSHTARRLRVPRGAHVATSLASALAESFLSLLQVDVRTKRKTKGSGIIEVGQNSCQSTARWVESAPRVVTQLPAFRARRPLNELLMIQTTSPTSRRLTTQVAAFFDVDNTLLPGEASEVRFFRSLWQRGIVGWHEIRASAWWLLKHMPPPSLQSLRERKLYLAGKPVQVIEPLGEEFCREALCPRVAADGLKKMDEHRQAGHLIILVTGSLDFLIDPIAEALEVDRCIAAELEEVNGLYTGELVAPLPYGAGKRQLILQLAEELGLDLSTCFAYGDSPGDREILEAVGHPTVVNPIRGMTAIAKRRGWPIQQWR